MNSTAGLRFTHSLLQEDTLRAWLCGKPVELQPYRNLTQASVPVFLVLILVELAVSCLLHEEIYQWRRTFSNLAAGLFVMLAGVLFKSLNVLPYALLHRSVGWRWEGKGGLLDGLAFILADLGYYCFHRFSHATNLGWSAHVTHHSSPDYNLSTALRQGAWEQLMSWAFYLPMALLVPPHVMLFYRSLNTTLQFWVHTQLVRSLGPLELVLNTPSHHRVHHARNYRSANYGGVFIVWDRLFGTFLPELAERPCVYGLDDRKVPLDTHNPLWHQLHQAVATARMMAKAAHPLALLFSRQQLPPAMEAASTEIPGRKAFAGRQIAEAGPNLPHASSSVSLVDGYVAAHFFGAIVPASLAAIGAAGSLHPLWTLLAVFGNITSLSCLGLLLDGDPPSSSRALETARLLVVAAACHLLRHLAVLPRSFPCDLVLLASALSIALVWSLGHPRLPSSRKIV